MRRALAAVAVGAVLVLAVCGDEVDSGSDDVFRLDGWSEVGWQEDTYRLEFTNMTTDKGSEWRGDAEDALDHLLMLDAGKCYTHPLTNPDPVPCG